MVKWRPSHVQDSVEVANAQSLNVPAMQVNSADFAGVADNVETNVTASAANDFRMGRSPVWPDSGSRPPDDVHGLSVSYSEQHRHVGEGATVGRSVTVDTHESGIGASVSVRVDEDERIARAAA